MTKKSIVRTVAAATGLPYSLAHRIVHQTITAISAALIADRRVELRGLGVFEVRKRAARRARNPRNGESVLVPEKLVAFFRPAQQLKARVHEQHIRPGDTTRDAA